MKSSGTSPRLAHEGLIIKHGMADEEGVVANNPTNCVGIPNYMYTYVANHVADMNSHPPRPPVHSKDRHNAMRFGAALDSSSELSHRVSYAFAQMRMRVLNPISLQLASCTSNPCWDPPRVALILPLGMCEVSFSPCWKFLALRLVTIRNEFVYVNIERRLMHRLSG